MSFYTFRSFSDACFLLAALALAVASLLLVLTTLADHIRNFEHPALQTCCMRILLLAPIYAIVSWSMMVFLPWSTYIEVLRDVYEAYTLYCFWVMLVLWCGGQRRVVDVLDRLDAKSCLLCPLLLPVGCGLRVWQFSDGKSMFRYLRLAIMQLMAVKPMVSLLCAAVMSTADAPRIKQLRLLAVVAMALAMHSIFTLYVFMKAFMRGLDASGKFVGIKIVVGIILLQQIVVHLLLSMDLIPEGRFGYTAKEHAQRLTCSATILEMAAFSLLLSYLFSHRSMTHGEAQPSLVEKLVDGVAYAGDVELGAPRGGQELRSRGTLFEQMIGEAAPAGQRRQTSEAVTLASVFAFWDVLTMGRVEEQSMQCGAGIPLPVELNDAAAVSQRAAGDSQAGAVATKSVNGRGPRSTVELEVT